ncbi:MAG TPA: hypothetical protein VNL17_14725 [Verrucomicrobiae bacterium]|nr:hypothetical protein [Verrucomicrobiae bacterium]
MTELRNTTVQVSAEGTIIIRIRETGRVLTITRKLANTEMVALETMLARQADKGAA